MNKHDRMLHELRSQLGDEYTIRYIDFERCLYRDFGNGFNVEISGVDTTKADKPATLYLWFGDKPPCCMIVKTLHDVARSDIGRATDELYEYTEHLIRDRSNNWDALFRIRHPEVVLKANHKF